MKNNKKIIFIISFILMIIIGCSSLGNRGGAVKDDDNDSPSLSEGSNVLSDMPTMGFNLGSFVF